MSVGDQPIFPNSAGDYFNRPTNVPAQLFPTAPASWSLEKIAPPMVTEAREYDIAYGSFEQIIKVVNGKLSEGWYLFGGLQMTILCNTMIFAQALVKLE